LIASVAYEEIWSQYQTTRANIDIIILPTIKFDDMMFLAAPEVVDVADTVALDVTDDEVVGKLPVGLETGALVVSDELVVVGTLGGTLKKLVKSDVEGTRTLLDTDDNGTVNPSPGRVPTPGILIATVYAPKAAQINSKRLILMIVGLEQCRCGVVCR